MKVIKTLQTVAHTFRVNFGGYENDKVAGQHLVVDYSFDSLGGLIPHTRFDARVADQARIRTNKDEAGRSTN